MIIDTHCHIHDKEFPLDTSETLKNAIDAGIKKLICVGTTVADSILAVEFAKKYTSADLQIFASIGVHPHETASATEEDIDTLRKLAQDPIVVAIGEIGLDYHYNNSPHNIQKDILLKQLQIADEANLPVIFHTREAFDDFWSVLETFESKHGKITGVVHSFTDDANNLKIALDKGFYIGVNGISTFVKKPEEIEMFSEIPLEKMLLETDAPFLAPAGKRGKPNQPAYVKLVAEDISKKRGLDLDVVINTTTNNAEKLFNI